MIQRFNIMVLLLVMFLIGDAAAAFAGPGPMMGGRGPYGGYCQGQRWGWYGARTPVSTADEARKHLEKFFEGQPVTIGAITDEEMFYKADITDRQGKLIDQVIVHKRSGRIRSTF